MGVVFRPATPFAVAQGRATQLHNLFLPAGPTGRPPYY